MKRLFVIFILFVISFVFFTSCDLFHTNNTTRGNSYALIYGVADYIGSSNDLTYTYNDAFDMNEFFTEQDFITTTRFNSDATKSAMLTDMESLSNNPDVDENTITVFFFAGHGAGSDNDVGEASLVPYFTTWSSSEIFYASEFLDEISAIPGKKLVILDICFAGGFVPENGVDVDGLPGDYGYFGDSFIFFQTWEKYLSEDTKTEYQDIWVIGSAGENEQAYEGSSLQNGYYTYYLLQGLGFDHENPTKTIEQIPADRNSDQLITISEIYQESLERFQVGYIDPRLHNLHNYIKNPPSMIKYEDYIVGIYNRYLSNGLYISHLSGGLNDLILLDLTH